MAFAAPDFPVLTPSGIPDMYTGRTLVQMFRYVEGITIPSDDYFIIIPPVPGVSHFVHEGVPDQNTSWLGKNYSNYSSLFGELAADTADTVTAFRYMAQLAELVPTTNNMSWTGSISVYKVPVKATLSNYISTLEIPNADSLDVAGLNWTITGLEGVTATNSDQYTAPSNLGCFSAAHQNNNDFPFTNTIEGYGVCPKPLVKLNQVDVPVGQYGRLTPEKCFPGFGQLDTIVIRITGAKNNTFVLKTWAAMELQINNQSALYQYTIQSPIHDPGALLAYNSMVRSSPNAVSYYENAGFWNFIKNAIKTVSGAMSALPGPVGAIANGVNAAIGLLR